MNRKTASDILREKYLSSQLKKVANEKSHPTLNEVGGIKDLLPEIHSKLYRPLFEREKYTNIGARPPKSLLIYGISGVGKTFLVNCFCQQYKLPLISSFVETPKDIKDLFMKSKSLDRSVILIKNVEVLSEEKPLIYQLNESLEAMDWCSVVVMTNKDVPEGIRHENEIFVRIPSLEGRKEILDGLIKGLKTVDIDTMEIAQNTPGLVAGGLLRLVALATTRALDRQGEPANITAEDFQEAIKKWRSLEKGITFDDIGALERVKEELRMSILLPSRFPSRFLEFGISRPSGILLYGPPGCGKTLIAKAVSNMSHCNFLSVKGPELITKYVGDSEKHLRDLFQKAKNLSPCVLFFDEIDSICGKRGTNEFGARIVNQILTLLDGMEDRGEVYLIGATNRINRIDPALLRPGRFDKIIEVPLPTAEEAVAIFEKCLQKVPNEGIDSSKLDLDGFSGADIAGLIKEAAILCLKENFEEENLKITEKYIYMALKKVRAMKDNMLAFDVME